MNYRTDLYRHRHRQWQAQYRKQVILQGGPMRVDATGTRRRIQALAAIGWPLNRLSAQLGWDRSRLRQLSRSTVVHRDTAARIERLYEQLSGTPGPSRQTRERAGAAGWVPPLEWDDIDDPTAVPYRHTAAGRADWSRQPRTTLGLDERVADLTAAGVSLPVIADRLGVTERTISRARARLRGQAA